MSNLFTSLMAAALCSLSAVAAPAAAGSVPPPVSGAETMDTTVVFSTGNGRYATTRIPAMVMTRKGTLLAFCEGRISGRGDWATIDILMRRSRDGGKTWEPQQTLVPHDPERPTTSNSTPIVDRNGTIHFIFQRNYGRAYYMQSKDDGKTWSEPRDITATFEAFRPDYNWKVLAPGPGHAIQLRSGRLVVPVWLCEPPEGHPHAHRPSVIATIYSDDHGRSWKRGEIIVRHGDKVGGETIVNPSESVVVELADGRVMINMRTESAPHRRLISYSPDGASDWSEPEFDQELFDPVCMASLLRISGGAGAKKETGRILFVNPDSRGNPGMLNTKNNFRRRENITARMSYDEGKTWEIRKVLFPGQAGYSDLAVGEDGTIYCLYEMTEGDGDFWKQQIVLQRFDLSWLTDGADAWPAGKRSKKKSTSPMNVLFISLDDMNDWIHLLDSNAPIRTPNLERLARKGTLFTQAYCASPSCNPSRTAVLTGKMPSSTGVYNNATDWKTAMPDAVTLPRYFMQQGYRTEGAGKIFHHHLNGAFHDSTAFDEFQQMPWPPDAPMPKEKLNGLKNYGTLNTDWGAWPANDSLHVDARTVRYVTGKLEGTYNKPFFLAAGIFRPHMPFFVPGSFYDNYPAGQVQMPVVKEDDLDDIPAGGRKLWEETRWFFDGMMKAENERAGTWREAVRGYQASATYADAQVGKILDALEQSPYADNTIIVLWSDHGYHLGEKQHWEKFALWEKTTHVPFIIVAPGITTPGTRCDQPVSLIDIYPTLLELCGLDPREDLDGQSLVPLLKDPEAIREHPAVMTYGKGNHAVRKGKWRYIRYADGTEELYDREEDPNEWENLAGTPSAQSVMEELKQWLPRQEAPVAPDMKKPRKKRKK